MSEDPDAVVDHRPDRCACCGGTLQEDLPAEIVSVSERIELPEVAPAVIQHRRLAVHCPTCGMQVVAPVPNEALGVKSQRKSTAWARAPCSKRVRALRARFDRIFKRTTGAVMLDWLLARLHRHKAALLRVLEWPEIPLHTNGSENDTRACVTKRKISDGTMSEAGRIARDVMLGLMKTCAKLGVSFFRYYGDRLGIPDGATVAPLPDLVRNATTA